MFEILKVRETVIKFYKSYESAFRFVFKFFAALFLFNMINGIGGFDERFEPLFRGSLSMPFLLLMSLFFAVSPPTVGNLLIGINLVLQISVSPVTAVLAGVVIAITLMLYSRLDPEKSYLIIIMVLGFRFNIPYAVVLFAGLYFGIASIVPVSIGTFFWSFIPLFKHLFDTVTLPEEIDIMSIPTTFSDIYQIIFDSVTSDFEWVFFCFVFAMAIVCVHFVSRLSINYSKEISVLLGGVVSIFGMISASVLAEINVSTGAAVGFSLLSVVIVELLAFFDMALNYNKTERVQFEDDDFYYYVKAVPKISVQVKTKEVNPVREAEPEFKIRDRPSRPLAPDFYDDSEFDDDSDFYDDDTEELPAPKKRFPPPANVKRIFGNPAPKKTFAKRPGFGKVKKRMTVDQYRRYKAKPDAGSAVSDDD